MPTRGEWTDDDLIAGAAERGYQLTKRKIVDWTTHGLLDRPRVRGTGRGSAKSVRPDHQAMLLWELLRQQAGAAKIATLTNFPVFIWLRWGSEYVSIGQVRKAMRTFSEDGATAPMTRARHTARDYLDVLNITNVTRAQRERLEEVLIAMTASTNKTLEPFATQFAAALTGVVAPNGTTFDLPIVESMLWAVDCRMRAADAFRTGADAKKFSDHLFKTIQLFYQQTTPQYGADKQLSAVELNQELANTACATLLLLLGRELTPFPPPGSTRQTQR